MHPRVTYVNSWVITLRNCVRICEEHGDLGDALIRQVSIPLDLSQIPEVHVAMAGLPIRRSPFIAATCELREFEVIAWGTYPKLALLEPRA